MFEVINNWNQSREMIGSEDECYNFVDSMAEFTTQSYTVREVEDDEDEEDWA